VGDRSRQTLKPLYERVDANFKPGCYATDDYACYTATLPEARHATGKDLTYTTEQHNSDTRHWLARFRRKSKVVSHCTNMVRLSLIAVEYVHKGEGLRKLTERTQLGFTQTLKCI
jgi:insertion element IS1 protein InsB